MITQQDVQQCVAGANASFGCGAGGQCCTQFRLQPVTSLSNPDVAHTVDDNDAVALKQRNRDSDCYNVCFVDALNLASPGGGHFVGATYTSGDTGSLVETSGRAVPDYSSTFRHELGHALGLAPDEKDDPRGVDGHSPRNDNVMKSGGNPPRGRTRLNEYQCKVARRSGLVTKKLDDCNENPGPI
jgi:hypothetical protein